MPTNFCHASVVNVFLKEENAAKGNLAANAHRSKFNVVLEVLLISCLVLFHYLQNNFPSAVPAGFCKLNFL
jgi:hypothetical protein